MRLFFLIAFAFFLSYCSAQVRVLNSDLFSSSEHLDSCLLRLYSPEEYSDFKVLHIGDSHVQGVYWGGQLRERLSENRNAKQSGFLFPYSAVKSYGPKGLKASLTGNWIGGNWLKENGITEFGLGGYSLKAVDESAKIDWQIEKTLFGDTVRYVGIWHKGNMRIDSTFLLLNHRLVEGCNIQYSLYLNTTLKREFSLESGCDGYQFFGLNLASDTDGFEYHKCGLVGAQFTHMIQSVDQWKNELKLWNPDLVILSFGTNEAYNGFMDTLAYENKVRDLMRAWNDEQPQSSFMVTAPPNTSSRNRIPPYENFMIRVWRRQCLENGWGYFDLHEAMGGDSSWSKWLKLGYMGTDQLHFKSSGYSLQADIVVHSIRSYVRDKWPGVQLVEEDWERETEALLASIYTMKNPLLDSPPQAKTRTHVVRSGETLSSIGRKYGIPYTAIQKANNLRGTTIYPGQKLRIPH